MFDLSERIKIVVDDLLSVTLDEGLLEPEIAPQNMAEMLQEIILGLSNLARHKGIEITVHPAIQEDFPKTILTDRREFKGIIHR